MPEHPAKAAPVPDHSDWNPALPAKVPKPTQWPAALALGATFILWGLASSPIITGVGLVLFIISLTGWIQDIRHERKEP